MTLIFKEKWKFSTFLHFLQKNVLKNPENENYVSNYALFSAKYPFGLTIIICSKHYYYFFLEGSSNFFFYMKLLG